MPDKNLFLNSGPSSPDLPKSTFDKSFTNHLTARFGRLYPCLVEEVVAGSSYRIKPDMAFDMMPMAFPIQSNMRAHLSIFNVPFRILQKNYKDVVSRVGDHPIPYISRPSGWTGIGTLSDYMGVPSAQVSEVTSRVSVDLFLRGYSSHVYSSSRLPSVSDFEGWQGQVCFGSRYHSFNDLISSTHSSGCRISVISNVVSRPIIGSFLLFGFRSSSLIPNSSIGVLGLHVVVFRKGSLQDFQVFSLNTQGVPFSSSSSSSSQVTYGISNSVSSGTSVLNDIGVSLYDQSLYFRFTDDVLSSINYIINSEDYDLRFFVTYPLSAASVLGPVSEFGYVDKSLLLGLVQDVSTKPSEQTGEISTTNVIMSNLIGSLSYDTSVGDFEQRQTWFDSVNGEPPKLPITAYAFRAYEFIYNKYFRNQQVDPFYKDGEVSYNQFLTNDGDGADGTTPVDFFNVPYEYDEFTTALKSPQAGFAPLVGVSTNDETGIGYLDMVPIVDGQPDPTQAYKIGVRYSSDTGTITGISNYDEVADKTSVMRLTEAIDFGISINDFRNVSAFQRMKEKMLKAGYQYQDLVKEFFGTTPPIGEEFPEYLGGMTRDVFVGKIQNQALTQDHPLGEFAGVGGVTGDGKTIKCFCAEAGLIMGVLWFSVTPVYSQAIPKHFLKHHILDYFVPTLNSIGAQPIMKHEIAPLQCTEEQLNEVFGYQRPWYDYVSRRDECHGNFRGNQRNFLLQRFFLDAPELTAQFINIHSEDLTDVFTVTQDTDKFFGMIHFDMKVKSPVARISVPRIIG